MLKVSINQTIRGRIAKSMTDKQFSASTLIVSLTLYFPLAMM